MNDETTTSTAELVKEAVAEARELARIEIALAKAEVKREAAALLVSAVAFGVAAIGTVCGLVMVVMGVALAAGPLAAIIIGLAILVIAGGAALFGVRHLPHTVLDRTRRRIQGDLEELKERVA